MPNLTRQSVLDSIRDNAAVADERVVALDDGTKVPFRVWSAEAQARLGSLLGKGQAAGDEADQMGWDMLRVAIRLAVVDDQGRPVFDSADLVGQWIQTLSEHERAEVSEAAQWVLSVAGLAPSPEAGDDPKESLASLGNGSSVTNSS